MYQDLYGTWNIYKKSNVIDYRWNYPSAVNSSQMLGITISAV